MGDWDDMVDWSDWDDYEVRVAEDALDGPSGPDDLGACVADGCGGTVRRRRSRYGWFYSCDRWPGCDVTVGCHADGRPLGTPADGETKKWRIKAHEAIDPLWGSGFRRRSSVYRDMARSTGVRHIGESTIADCKRVIRWAKRLARG